MSKITPRKIKGNPINTNGKKDGGPKHERPWGLINKTL
jgi:hypothetical protein